MSPAQKKKSKSIIWVVGIITILLVTPIFIYLASTQLILKPIESEEKRAWQSYQENRQLRKKYEERQSILMQVAKAKRARLLAMNTLEAMAKDIPNGVTLDALSFIESRNSQGNNVLLRGRVSQENASKLKNYADALTKAKNAQAANQPLFSQVMPPNVDARAGGYLSWTIICTIKMEELNAVNEHGLILPEAPQPVNYQREMEGQSTLKIFLDGKKRLQSVAAKLKKEKEDYNQIFDSIPTIKPNRKNLPFASDANQAQYLMAEINSTGRRAGLNFTRSRGSQSSPRKDQVFDEQRRIVSFQCEPKDLVNFIQSIHQEMTAVRVRDLMITTTADRQQLKVDLTLSVHFLKSGSGPKSYEAIKWLPTASLDNEKQNKAIHQYLDKASQTFTKSDAFRLIKPTPPEEPKIVAPPRVPVKVPQLAGLLRINGKESALLRISPPRGGKAVYLQLQTGERQHGVEIGRIDLKQEIVEVIINGNTFSLQLSKTKASSSRRASSAQFAPRSSGSRPTTDNSGLSGVPSRGSSFSEPESLKAVPSRQRSD